jgi:hypothetical protein
MKTKSVFVLSVFVITACCPFVFAKPEFGKQFGRVYVEDSKNEDFKKLVAEAKCNVCHVERKNKQRNPYGAALLEAGLTKEKYEPMLKSNPDQAKKEIEEILKKVEEEKIDGEEKTFGEKIKDGLLPGGDVNGK